MRVSGRFGVGLGWGALFVVVAFVGCGGSSKSSGGSGDGDDGDDRGGTSGSSSGGSGGASPGSGGASQGGSGATRPVPPPGTQYCGGVPCDAPRECCMAT